MKIEQILEIILDLSRSQGFYGRLYEELITLKEECTPAWNVVVETLEAQDFKEPLDLILYLEQ